MSLLELVAAMSAVIHHYSHRLEVWQRCVVHLGVSVWKKLSIFAGNGSVSSALVPAEGSLTGLHQLRGRHHQGES